MNKNSFLLKVNSEENILFLEEVGYENVQKITYDNMRTKVVVVDESEKSFMPISVTCLAGIAGTGVKPINFEEFRVINEINNIGVDD